MLNLYTGTPGSGKGYHIAHRIFHVLRHCKLNIICTCPIDLETLSLSRLGWLKKRLHDRFGLNFKKYNKVKLKGRFYYWTYAQMTVQNLLTFAKLNHDPNYPRDKWQTLVIIDEGGVVFNCRDFAAKDRMEWVKFFPMHRHYGFEMVIACQFDRQIDRQVRNLVEVEYRHRNVAIVSLFGLLKTLFHFQMFFCFGYWYATKQEKRKSTDIFIFRPQIGAIYNTLSDLYDELFVLGDKLPAGCAVGGGDSGAPPPAARWPGAFALRDIVGWVKRVTQTDAAASGAAPAECVTLDKLFGRGIDVTKPISEQGAAVPGAGVSDDAVDLGDADHGADGRGGIC